MSTLNVSAPKTYTTDRARGGGGRVEGSGYREADEELTGYFLSSVGVGAQSYEPSAVAPTSNAEGHYRRLRAMRWLTLAEERSAIEWFDAVTSTLRSIAAPAAHLLAAVYEPHGRPAWLADRLTTPSKNGSFVRLAASMPTACEAYERSHHRPPSSVGAVLMWFEDIGRGSHDAMFSKLRDECEGVRRPALAAYDKARRARRRLAAEESRARAERESQRRVRLLEEERERVRGRETARFESRIGCAR